MGARKARRPARSPVELTVGLARCRNACGRAAGYGELVEADRRATHDSIQAAVAIANRILQGQEDPYTAARRLSQMQLTCDRLQADLMIFFGLATHWEDLPQDREELEREIVIAADRFRAKWEP